MEYFYPLDQFSEKPKLKINGKHRLKNIYIAILGLFIFIGILIVTIILSLDIFNKNTINIIQNTVSNSKKNNFTLDTTIPYSLLVTNNLGVEFDEPDRLFEIQSRFFTYIPNKSKSEIVQIIKINQTECKYKNLEGDIDSENNFGNVFKVFKTIKCFDLEPYNLSIYGDLNPGIPASYLQFYLNKCTNSTGKNNCFPQYKIDKKLKDVKMSVIFPNKDIDTLSSNPIRDFTDGKIFRFSSTIQTKYFLEIDGISFLSNEGLFFEDNVKKESYRIEKVLNFQKLEIGGDLFSSSFGVVGFNGSGRKINYHRSYKTIDTLFPHFYTIYYFTCLFFKVFLKFLLKGNLEEYLIFKIFNIETFSKIKLLDKRFEWDNLFTKIPKERNGLSFINSNNLNENENININMSNNNNFPNFNENMNNNQPQNLNIREEQLNLDDENYNDNNNNNNFNENENENENDNPFKKRINKSRSHFSKNKLNEENNNIRKREIEKELEDSRDKIIIRRINLKKIYKENENEQNNVAEENKQVENAENLAK